MTFKELLKILEWNNLLGYIGITILLAIIFIPTYLFLREEFPQYFKNDK